MQATRTAIFVWAPVLYASVFLSAGTATAQLESALQGGSTAPNSYYDLAGPGYDSALPENTRWQHVFGVSLLTE